MPKTKNTNPSPVVEVDKTYDVNTVYTNKSDGTTYDIGIMKSISFTDMGALIHIITNMVISEDGCYPHFYETAFWGNILDFFTDIDKNFGLEDVYKIINETDIQDVLRANILSYQFETIEDSIYELIEFKKQQLANKSEMDGLFSDIRVLVSKFSDGFDSETMTKAMGNLAGLTSVDEKNVIGALVDNLKSGKGKVAKAVKKGKKDNVTVLPPVGQIDFDGGILEE